MASLVLAVGSSHGPSIQTTADNWPRLGEKDARDTRMDYQALLRRAPAGLEKELTPEIQHARHAASHAALDRLAAVIAESALDAVVVISNAHNLRSQLVRPVFGILRSAVLPVRERDGDLVGLSAEREQARAGLPDRLLERRGQPELANHLLERLVGAGIDVACIDRLAEGRALDDAFAFCFGWLLRGADIPVVPFYLSRDLPNQALPTRCWDLGLALGDAIASWPGNARVGLIASGGLSHQVLDETLDRMVITALEAGDEATLRGLSRERINGSPGTPEILNWVTVAAAMAPRKMQLVDYVPAYRSLASTGHGLTFGLWR